MPEGALRLVAGIAIIAIVLARPIDTIIARHAKQAMRAGYRDAVLLKAQEAWNDYVPFMIRHPGQHIYNKANDLANLVWNTPEYLREWIGTYDD